jgi:photosystem II stability/assembly factor-like uncharacterized protein
MGVGKGRWAFLLMLLLAATGCWGESRTAEKPVPPTAPVGELVGTAASPVFRPTGVSFIDESEGWVSGGGCGIDRCARFLHTRDGGRRWEPVGALAPEGMSTAEADEVKDVRFSDARNGWAFDRGLWSTHDGGATWTVLHVGSPVLALETTGAKAYALVASCRNGRSDCSGPVQLYEATVGSDDWRPVFDVDVGSPPSPNGRLVVSGRSVYAVVHPYAGSPQPGKPANLYALTPGGRWERRSLPSSCYLGPPALAAAGRRDLYLWCQTGDGAGGSAPHEFHVSRDGGLEWTRIWARRSVYFDPVAVTIEGRFLAESIEDLRIDRPDGSHESIRFRYSAENRCGERVHAIRFVTSRQGVVLTCLELYITRDGGRHWDPVALQL